MAQALAEASNGATRDAVRAFQLGLGVLALSACTFEPPPADVPPGPRLPFGLLVPPLEWQAFGLIRDGGYDDPFRWCYHFTVLAWDGDVYAAQVDQRDNRGLNGDPVGREVPFGW